MLETAIEQHFMKPDHKQLWKVALTPEEAVEMALAEDKQQTFSAKF